MRRCGHTTCFDLLPVAAEWAKMNIFTVVVRTAELPDFHDPSGTSLTSRCPNLCSCTEGLVRRDVDGNILIDATTIRCSVRDSRLRRTTSINSKVAARGNCPSTRSSAKTTVFDKILRGERSGRCCSRWRYIRKMDEVTRPVRAARRDDLPTERPDVVIIFGNGDRITRHCLNVSNVTRRASVTCIRIPLRNSPYCGSTVNWHSVRSRLGSPCQSTPKIVIRRWRTILRCHIGGIVGTVVSLIHRPVARAVISAVAMIGVPCVRAS